MKKSNGTLGGGDLYEGRVTAIKSSGFVNSRVEGGRIPPP
jgi:hypothetical protein